MKNHFIFGYAGNKRSEVEKIYNLLEENKILDNKKCIIEPFCGTSAISVYIALKHPKKYKYILNDNNKYLIELYKIFQDDEEIKKFIEKINNLCFDDNSERDDNFINKEQYLNLLKYNDIYSWFIFNKYYVMRAGLYPLKRKMSKLKYEDVLNLGIVKFLREEDIKIYNIDSIDIIKKYEDEKNLLILDPPYLESYNSFYKDPNLNIYEYLYFNKNIKNIVSILNDTWICKLLFKDYKSITYDKLYQSTKRETKHTIYYN